MRNDIYSPLNQKLSALLHEARKKAGVTQVELAKGTGRTQAYISKFERGHLRLDVSDLIAFTAALEIDPHKLIDELLANLKAEAAKTSEPKKTKPKQQTIPPLPQLPPDAHTWSEEELAAWMTEVKHWFSENPGRAVVRKTHLKAPQIKKTKL